MTASTREKTLKRTERNFFAYTPYQIENEYSWIPQTCAKWHGKFRFSTWKLSLSAVERFRCWSSTIETMKKTKNTKKLGGAIHSANQQCRRRREMLEEKNSLQCTRRLVFFSFFHRCLVCEVRSRDLYFQFVHKYRSAYTYVDIVRNIYCFLKKHIFSTKSAQDKKWNTKK